jgi:hypothetical protein
MTDLKVRLTHLQGEVARLQTDQAKVEAKAVAALENAAKLPTGHAPARSVPAIPAVARVPLAGLGRQVLGMLGVQVVLVVMLAVVVAARLLLALPGLVLPEETAVLGRLHPLPERV